MESSKKRGNPLWLVIKTEWDFLGERKKHYIFFMSLFLIAGVIALFTPWVIGMIFNSVQNEITNPGEFKTLIFNIFLLLVITVGFWIFHGTARALEELSGFYVHRNYTNSKIKKILALPVWWHKDHHTGDTIDKINRGRGSIESVSTSMTYNILYAFINIFGSLAILFFVDWKIASVVTALSVIILSGIILVDKTFLFIKKIYIKLSNFCFLYKNCLLYKHIFIQVFYICN